MKLINDTFKGISQILESIQNRERVGIFPGAFKPPHRGHYLTAANACSQNDTVYILMSPIARLLGKPSSTGGGPEWKKFKGLLDKDNVKLAKVDRETSASAMRREIEELALSIVDIETFEANMQKYLPEMNPQSKEVVLTQLMSVAIEDGKITAKESSTIWRLYIDQLQRDFPRTTIKFEVVASSPIAATYELVDELIADGDRYDISLYTGE